MTPKDGKDVSEYEGVEASILQLKLKLSRASPSSYISALGSGSEMKTQSRTKYTKHCVIHELGKARDLDEFSGMKFFSSVFPFTSNTKGSRGTDGEDTALPRHTSALPGGSLVAIITFQVSAERQCWAWVGFYVPSDACLHKDFCLLVLIPKHGV